MPYEDPTNVLVLIGGIFMLAFALIYGFGSPWYRSLLGAAIFGMGFANLSVLAVVLTRRWVPDFPYHEQLAFTAYLIFAASAASLLAMLIIERRRAGLATLPLRRHRRKESDGHHSA